MSTVDKASREAIHLGYPLHKKDTKPGIKGQSLEDEIADYLRKAVLEGDLAPGERLIEADLSRSLGVSRAPIREALKELAAEGLVVLVPRKGTFVVQLSEKDIREIYGLRLALETHAVSLLVDSITDDQIEELQGFIQGMRQGLADGDLREVIDLDMRFHETICRFSGNSRVVEAWLKMGGQLRSFFSSAERFYTDRQTIEAHQAIVNALAEGNKSKALSTLDEHISGAAERVISGAVRSPRES